MNSLVRSRIQLDPKKGSLFYLSLQRLNSIIVCVLVKVSKNIFWNHGAALYGEHPRILKLFNWFRSSFISVLVYLTAAVKSSELGARKLQFNINRGRKARDEQFNVTSIGWKISLSMMKAERKLVVRLRNASPTMTTSLTVTGVSVMVGSRVCGE